jgi:hypothetical protein
LVWFVKNWYWLEIKGIAPQRYGGSLELEDHDTKVIRATSERMKNEDSEVRGSKNPRIGGLILFIKSIVVI